MTTLAKGSNSSIEEAQAGERQRSFGLLAMPDSESDSNNDDDDDDGDGANIEEKKSITHKEGDDNQGEATTAMMQREKGETHVDNGAATEV